jgi:RNA polymerase sigma-70 factor (ECF subfamily)
MTIDLSSVTDAQLLARAADGDNQGLTLLITRYHRPFMAMAFANSLSRADSEEAVGDAFVKIWHSAANYKDHGLDAKYWLRTLMRHALLDKLRSLKRFAPEQSATRISDDGAFLDDDYGNDVATVDSAQTPPNLLEALQDTACFDACLGALSEAHRDTLQRCLLAGQTEAEIAHETVQPLGTVKSRKHTAVKKMQLCVADCVSGLGHEGRA